MYIIMPRVERFTDYESVDFDDVDWFPSWSPDGARVSISPRRSALHDGRGGRIIERLTDGVSVRGIRIWSGITFARP